MLYIPAARVSVSLRLLTRIRFSFSRSKKLHTSRSLTRLKFLSPFQFSPLLTQSSYLISAILLSSSRLFYAKLCLSPFEMNVCVRNWISEHMRVISFSAHFRAFMRYWEEEEVPHLLPYCCYVTAEADPFHPQAYPRAHPSIHLYGLVLFRTHTWTARLLDGWMNACYRSSIMCQRQQSTDGFLFPLISHYTKFPSFLPSA